jgi:hypothetical protein
MLQKKMLLMNINNFEALLDQPDTFPDPEMAPKKNKQSGGHKEHDKTPEELAEQVAAVLVQEFTNFFFGKYGEAVLFLPKEHFTEFDARAIGSRLHKIQDSNEIQDLIGGETIKGELEMLHSCVVNFQKGEQFTHYIEERDKYNWDIQDKLQETLNKKQTAAKQKKRLADDVEARKRKRAEDKVAKNEREAREKEAKRQK